MPIISAIANIKAAAEASALLPNQRTQCAARPSREIAGSGTKATCMRTVGMVLPRMLERLARTTYPQALCPDNITDYGLVAVAQPPFH